MRTYELVYILRTDLGDEAIATQVEKIQTVIKDQGGVINTVEQGTPWGRRKLAYEIADQLDGYYVLNVFDLDPVKCTELERILKLNEAVIRYLLIVR